VYNRGRLRTRFGLGTRLPLEVFLLAAALFAVAAYLYVERNTSVAPASREEGAGQLGPPAVTPSYSLAVAQPLTQALSREIRLNPNKEQVIDMPERDVRCSGGSCWWILSWSVREPYPLLNAGVEIIKVSGMGDVSSFALANAGEGSAQYFGLVSIVNRTSSPLHIEVRYLLLSSK
jgi:hypothetical protein